MKPADTAQWRMTGPRAIIGRGVMIGKRNKFYGLFNIRGDACIGSDNQIMKNCRVGFYAVIGSNCSFDISSLVDNGAYVGDETHIGFMTRLSEDVTIKSEGHVENYADIGKGAKLGTGNVVGAYANIRAGAELGNEVSVGFQAQVGPKAKIGNKAIIGEKAKVLGEVTVPARTAVADDNVVTRKTKFKTPKEK